MAGYNFKGNIFTPLLYGFHKNLKLKPSSYPYNILLNNKDKFLDLLLFASITNGIAKPIMDTSSTNANIQALVLDYQDLIKVEDPSMVLFVKLKDLNSMSNMYVIYRNKGTWNINIVDETLDSSDNIDVNGMVKVEDSVEENSLADFNDMNDLKETINELASNKIQHLISKENID
ncbi:hypothetical protein Tco_1402460 [Tanacetum coccineum]